MLLCRPGGDLPSWWQRRWATRRVLQSAPRPFRAAAGTVGPATGTDEGATGRAPAPCQWPFGLELSVGRGCCWPRRANMAAGDRMARVGEALEVGVAEV